VMTKERVRYMPVMSNGNLIGVISISDIIKSRLAKKDPKVAVLPDDIGDPRILFGFASVCHTTDV
jgi:hypothetical protein